MNSLALNVFNEMDQLQRELNHCFGTVRPRRRRFPRRVQTWPLVNVSEDADHIYVDALAPGIAPESLEVSMTGDQLTISGERSQVSDTDSKRLHRHERTSGRFHRSITVHGEVEGGKIDAGYKNGLLKIRMPRAEAAKPKKIKVSIG